MKLVEQCCRLWCLLTLLASTVRCQSSTSIGDLEDPHFIGYYLAPKSTERMTAAGEWRTSGTFVADCATDRVCSYATLCTDNTIFLDDGSSYTCDGVTFSCVGMVVLQTYPDGLPSATNIACRGGGWSANTVYREIPASVSASPTSSAVSSAESSSTSSSLVTSPTSTIPSASASATLSSPSSSSTETSKDKSSGSKAWIAGAVVGPVVGVALIGLAFWMGLRFARKREAGNTSGGAQQQYTEYKPEFQYQYQYYPQPQYPVEVDDAYSAGVLQQPRHELPGQATR